MYNQTITSENREFIAIHWNGALDWVIDLNAIDRSVCFIVLSKTGSTFSYEFDDSEGNLIRLANVSIAEIITEIKRWNQETEFLLDSTLIDIFCEEFLLSLK